MTNGPQTTLELPASVRRQLAAFQRWLLVIETLVAVLGGACGLLAAYFLLYLSDRLWDTPAGFRLALAIAATVCVAACAVTWLRRWWWHRRDARQLAVMVQRHYPRIGDRLLGIVELADASRRPPNISPALCRAAMQQVAAETVSLDFQRAVPKRWTRRAAIGCAALLAVAVLAGLTNPAAGLNALRRFLHPVTSIPRYTFVQLEGLWGRRIVPYGEAFDVDCRVKDTSRWWPDRARARMGSQPPIAAEAVAGSYRFHVPGQTKPGVLSVRVGDASEQLNILPSFRPDLTALQARLELPDYLGYPVSTQNVQNGALDLPEGSRGTLIGRVSRPLARATLQADTARTIHIDGDRFVTEPLLVTGPLHCVFQWHDDLGLTSKTPYELTLTPQKDQPPGVECRGLALVTAILEDEVLDFEVRADDDFGVQQIGVTWEGDGKAADGVAPARGESIIATGGPQQKELAGKFQFVPQVWRIKPQMITVRAVATDYYPGRAPSQSAPYRVYVLDRLQHAQLLQQQLEQLQEKLEDLAHAEIEAHETNRALGQLNPADLQRPETGEKLAGQERDEQAHAEAMRQLAEDLTKLLREALRNKDIPNPVLQPWAKLLELIAPVGQTGMPQVAQSLRNAQNAGAGQRRPNLQEALARQQSVLETLEKALKQMNRTGDQLLAANFVNRLRQAARAETDIGGRVTKLLPDTVGATVDQLPVDLKLQLNRLENDQDHNGLQVRYIQDDLGNFYNRTRLKRYEAVQQQMADKQVVQELAALAGLVHSNLGGRAIEKSRLLADQLEAWAGQLSSSPGSGAGGDGEGEPSATALEMMMKLLRIRQQEEGLREYTRFLEDRKSTLPDYTENARQQGRVQGALLSEIDEISHAIVSPAELAGLLGKVGDAMEAAGTLLRKPQTDGQTVGAETEAIELLSESMQQAGAGRAGASGEQFAALLRLLGARTCGRGGGSLTGGTTDRANLPSPGEASGSAAGKRAVEKAGGQDLSKMPAEFRSALKAYFEAAEGIEK